MTQVKSSSSTNIDDILDPTKNKIHFTDVQRQDLQDIYNLQLASIWVPSEVKYEDDAVSVKEAKLDGTIWRLLKYTVAFVLYADKILMDGIAKFTDHIHDASAKHFYGLQAAMEGIHNITYEEAAKHYFGPEEREELIELAENSKSVNKLFGWCKRFLDTGDGKDHKKVSRSVFGNAISEGLFFQSSFVFIFWLKSKGMFPAFAFANELISRDEKIHYDNGAVLIRKYLTHSKPPESEAREIMSEAVETLNEFFAEALGDGDLIGLTVKQMRIHIEYVADCMLIDMGYEKLYGVEDCPFDFMNSQAVPGKTNFFEKKVGEYSIGGRTIAYDSIIPDDIPF